MATAEASRTRREQLLAAGLCVDCGVNPLAGKRLCEACLAINAARARAVRAERRSRGRCTRCNRITRAGAHCMTCREAVDSYRLANCECGAKKASPKAEACQECLARDGSTPELRDLISSMRTLGGTASFEALVDAMWSTSLQATQRRLYRALALARPSGRVDVFLPDGTRLPSDTDLSGGVAGGAGGSCTYVLKEAL